MTNYELSFIRESPEGIVSKPLMALVLDATDDEGALREARARSRGDRPLDANAYQVLRDYHPFHRGWLEGGAGDAPAAVGLP